MKQLKRQRTILSSVARELKDFWWDIDDSTPQDRLPVVAVDWSEIFAYATYTPPRSNSTQHEFAAQYAGLCYLFFGLPCRLLLLPPYVIEMRNFLEMIEAGALLSTIEKPKGGVSSAYLSLTEQIEKQSQLNPSFAALLSQDFANVTELTPEVREILEELFKRYLPRVYLDLQQYTLDAVRALRRLTHASETAQPRLLTLKDLSPELPEACSGAVKTWEHWMGWMQAKRKGAETQNRTDAVALAYLAALHSLLFWKFRRLLFATRSAAMFAVMGRSPGEFPPSLEDYPGDGMYSLSSARSWEYFAEIGYYKMSKMALDEALRDLQQRETGVEQLLLSPSSNRERTKLLREIGRHAEIWETLRGSFDLEGMGEEGHWQRLKTRRDRLLVSLVRSLLSAESPEEFLEERRRFAKSILAEIDTLLGHLPDNLPQKRDARQEWRRGVRTFDVWALLELLSPRLVVKNFLKESCEVADALIVDLRTQRVTPHAAELLRWTSKRAEKADLPRSTIDWLAGFSLYGLGHYEEATVYFTNWLDAYASAVEPRLGLITRAIAADACIRRRSRWDGIDLLRGVSPEKRSAFQLTDRLVWYTLLTRFLIHWIEPFGEDSDLFPRGPDGNFGEAIIIRFAELVADDRRAIEQIVNVERQALFFNSLLYGAARYLPENMQIQRGKHQLLPHRPILEDVAKSLEAANSTLESPEYAHTLGYLHWKLFLIDKDKKRVEHAINLFSQAVELTDPSADEHLQELIMEHLDNAKEQLELM